MDHLVSADKSLVERWLEELGMEVSLCGQCEGLHLPALEDEGAVIDCRLFVMPYGLLLSTGFELRQSALLAVSADLGRMNMEYPTVKLFTDVLDDAAPQLVCAAILLTAAGVSREQFAEFVRTSLDATRQVAAECERQSYLYVDSDEEPPPDKALH